MYGHDEGIETDLPGMYLEHILFEEVGPSIYEAGVERPVDWRDLDAYANRTGELSEPWESRAIIRMSRAYFRAKVRGKDVHAIPPVELEE